MLPVVPIEFPDVPWLNASLVFVELGLLPLSSAATSASGASDKCLHGTDMQAQTFDQASAKMAESAENIELPAVDCDILSGYEQIGAWESLRGKPDRERTPVSFRFTAPKVEPCVRVQE